MATDLERLVVSLDADITRLTRQLAKGGIALDDFGKTAERKAQTASRAINRHLGPASGGNGLSFIQFQELSSAARHSFDAIVAGASPLRVLATEGTKASAAIGADGLGGFAKKLGTSLASVITPARIAGGGLSGIGLAALATVASFEEAQQKIRTGLIGIGAASHATFGDIEGISESLARSSSIGVSAARQIATSLAATGKIDVGQIGDIGGLAKGFGALTGKSVEDAGRDLAAAFANPAEGVDALNARFGSFDDKTVQLIKHLSASGDVLKAQQLLFRGIQPDIEKATQNIGALTKAADFLKAGFSNIYAGVGRDLSGLVQNTVDPSIEQRIATLKSQRGPQRDGLTGEDLSDGAALEKEIAALQAQLDAQKRAIKVNADKVAANIVSARIGAAERGVDPEYDAILAQQDKRNALGQGLSDALANPAAGQAEGGLQRLVDDYNSADQKLKELQRDYEKGGRFAAQAIREADFQKATAGLSSYERGLAAINHQYENLIESARKDPNTRALATVTEARDTAIEGYKRDAVEKAKAQAVIPSGYADVVIGAEGNNAAKNPRSSASGLGQFIDTTFIALYRKEYSDLAATMNDAAILKLKSDAAINKRLIEAYGRENAVPLQNAGFDTSSANLYLAHNYGPQGAIKLLRADPDTPAAKVLGQDAIAANPNIAGLSAQGVIDEAARRSQRFSNVGRSQQASVVSEEATAQAYDKSAAAAARLQSIQAQLDADREAGGELGRRFATAQQLEAASSGSLTPALQAQRKEVEALADARSRAVQTTLTSRFDTDQKNALAALGRTSDQQAVYTQAKQYGDPGSDPYNQAAAGLERIRALTEVKNEGSSFTKGLVEDLIRGEKAGKALEGQLQRILGKLADNAVDSLISSLFKGVLGGGGAGASSGIFGLLGGVLKLAGGGRVSGAGSSNSDSIPAMLSHGEFVVNAQSAAKNAGLLRLINKGDVLRLATGGPVGSLPALPSAVMPMGAAGGVTYAPTMQFGSPAAGVTPDQLARVLANERRQAARTILSTYANAKRRG